VTRGYFSENICGQIIWEIFLKIPPTPNNIAQMAKFHPKIF
jgi:hypothetical protein